MSVQQIEQTVRSLSREELDKFAGWFEAYYATQAPESGDDKDVELSPDQRGEIDRRLDALDADLSLGVPYEGTKEAVLRRLDEFHAAETRHR